MRIKFLCPQHREALLHDPDAARDYWLTNHTRIRDLAVDAPPYQAPTPHLVNAAGSALEAANIFLRARPSCASSHLQMYASSALALIGMLADLGQTRLGIVVVAVSNAMVEEVARQGADAAEALAACERLTTRGMAIVGGVHPQAKI